MSVAAAAKTPTQVRNVLDFFSFMLNAMHVTAGAQISVTSSSLVHPEMMRDSTVDTNHHLDTAPALNALNALSAASLHEIGVAAANGETHRSLADIRTQSGVR